MRAAQPASCAPLNPRHALHKHHRQSKAPLPLPQTPRRQKTQPKHSPALAPRKKGGPQHATPARFFCAHTPHKPEKNDWGRRPRHRYPDPPLRTNCDTHGEGRGAEAGAKGEAKAAIGAAQAAPRALPKHPRHRKTQPGHPPVPEKRANPKKHALPARFFCAHIIDYRNRSQPKLLNGWENINISHSEGNHEQIK